MKIIGIILAILLFGAVLAGAFYGVLSMSHLLSALWGSLPPDWKAGLIIVATVLVLCTLFASLLVRSALKSFGLKGPGKVMAYNDFVHWYSALTSEDAEAMQAENFKALTNQMTLWGSAQVKKQVNLLYELLQQDETTRVEVLKKADHVYIEIRRDLGLGGSIGKNALV